MPKVLHLTLHRRWFDLIASVEKREEYRAQSPYWRTRLEGQTFDEIHFRNGYSKTCPRMRVRCLGISTGEWNGAPCYVIRLGEILEIRRPEKDPSAAHPGVEARHAQA